MRNITRAMVAFLINRLGATRFDAHDLERLMLRFYPIAFGRDLVNFGQTSYPFHQFSAHFAKFVDREFEGQLHKTRKVRSRNLVGAFSSNQEWERSVAVVV